MKEIFFDEIDSTNTYLKNHYEQLEDMTFVSANLQTAGRGRKGRTWLSNKGENLMFSLLIKDSEMYRHYSSLSVISAYTIIEVLKEYGVDNLSFKWPNDVYVDGKKICGILLEAISREDLECLIIGVGINVNQKQFVGDYIREPVSLTNLLNKDIDLDELRKKIYERFIYNIDLLRNGYDFYDDIQQYDYLKDRVVYMNINNEIKQVKVIRVDNDYSLRILDDTGERNIDSGEVSFHV